MSYLGKISALVTVNTGDVAPKLNATAKSVQSFAKSVERDIGSSMRSAAKSLESIYTPLQRLERSLRAASSMKLSFGGFPGAIRDLDALKQRLTSLNQRQINVVLKASGVRSISAFREALSGLSSKEFSFIARVGGVEKLRELREAVAAGGGEFSVTARLGDANAKVDSLRKKLDDVRTAGSSVSIAVDASRVAAARTEVLRATEALKTFSGGMSDIERITPEALSSELAGRLVRAENKLVALKGRKGAKPAEIAAAQSERDLAASAAEQLATLRANKLAAERAEKSAMRGEQVGGPKEQKRIERDLRAAEKERRAALAEAQRVYRDVVGVDLTPKDIEKLTRGGSTALDDLLSRATRSQAAMLNAGGSGDFVDVVRNRVMPALGRSDLNANAEKERQRALAEAAITKPLAGVKDRLMAAGRDIEAAYLPALSRTQAAAQALNDTIEKSGGAAADVRGIAVAFGDVERQIRRDTAAVQQFAEATAAIGALKTGKELVFASPELSDALGRGAKIGRSAAGLPASVLAANPGIADSLAKVYGLSEKASAAFARLRALQNSDMPTDKAQERLDGLLVKLRKAQDEAERGIKIHVDTSAADAELAVLQRRYQAQKQLELDRQAQAQKAADSEIALIQRREQAAKAAELESQARAQKTADAEIAVLQRRQQAEKAAELERQAQAQKAADAEIAIIQRREQAAKAAELDAQARARRAADSEIAVLQRRQQAEKAAELERQARSQKAADAELAVIQRREQAAKAAELEAQARAQKAADSEIAVLQRREQAAKAAELERQAQAQKAADAEIALIQRREQAAKAAELEAQARAQKAADSEIAVLQRRYQAQKQLENEAQAQAQKREDDDTSVLIRREQAGKQEEQQRPTPLPAGYLADVAARQTRQELGSQVDDPRRRLDSMAGSIVSLKSQLDQLPMPLMAKFVPAVKAAEDEYDRLKKLVSQELIAPGSLSPKELEEASLRLRSLEADLKRADAASKFELRFNAEGLTASLDDKRLRGFTAQFELLETVLLRLSGKGLAAGSAAFNRYFEAVSAAAKNKTLSNPATIKSLEALRDEVAGEIAGIQGSGESRGSLRRKLKRTGDIGRMGADKASLALNQAAFAIDDFMSSTGGIEFKLRAISNNITQMAFVLGGTTGLFIGLGAVMASTVAISVMKWANGGKTAEDQTKALNEALARQKSLVEDLAQAFGSLGDSLSRGTLSAAGERARDFDTQVAEIKKKQREVRDESVGGTDFTVQEERARQNMLKRELESSTDPGRRVAISALLKDSERREREAIRAASLSRVPGGFVRQQVEKAAFMRESADVDAEVKRRTNDFTTPRAKEQLRERLLEEARQRAQREASSVDVGTSVEAKKSQIAALERANAGLTKISERRVFGFATPAAADANRELAINENALKSLQAELSAAIDSLVVSIVQASRGPAEQIRQAQEEVAEAVRSGLPGARLFEQALNQNATELTAATKKLKAAATGKDENDKPLTDADRERMANEAKSEIEALNARRRDIAAQADALRYERTVDPQRQIDARLGRARGNLNDAGLGEGRIARRMREIEAERETIRQRSMLPEFQTAEMQRGLNDVEQELNQEVAALEAATLAIKIFADALNKASDEARSNLTSAQQAADEARRADLANSTPATQEARAMAEAALERQRDAERQAQAEIAVERDRLEQKRQPGQERLQQIEEELKSGVDPAAEEKKKLVDQRAAVEAQVAADNKAAEEAVAQIKKVNDESTVAFDAVWDKSNELGATPDTDLAERNRIVRDAGFGNLVDASDKGFESLFAKRDALGLAHPFNSGDDIAEAVKRQKEIESAGAARLAELDAQIASAPDSRREDLIRERESIRAQMDDDARGSAAKVNELRDASTAEEERRKSGVRGAGMVRTPKEQLQLETEAGLADIREYFQQRAEGNNGLRPEGDVERQAAAEEQFRAEQEKKFRASTPEGRGREAFLTDRERFRRDINEGLVKDMTAGAIDQAGLMNMNGRADLLRQGISNQLESVAPMLKQFEDERQNALLQGPSRAAINVSDVTTTQGQSELNRLIRGDDAAKDVNLAELQKQTQKFDELIKAVKDANPGVLL